MTAKEPGISDGGTWAGFFPCLTAERDVSIEKAGIIALFGQNDVSIRQGGGQLIGAGNNVEVSEGGSFIMGAGNKVTIDKGGAGLVAARHVDLKNAYVGLAIGREVRFDGDSKPVLGPWPSVAVGFAVGLILGVLGRRRR